MWLHNRDQSDPRTVYSPLLVNSDYFCYFETADLPQVFIFLDLFSGRGGHLEVQPRRYERINL